MRTRQNHPGCKGTASGEAGMTLLELVIAIAVLAIGMLGAMTMILMAIQTDSRAKTDTTATVLDQEIIEKFSTLKQYPTPTAVNVYDCALNATNLHQADPGQGATPSGNGAVLYTSSTAPTPAQVGDIDWTQPAPTLATATTLGYAMQYQTCSGEIYELRWNVMNLVPAPPSGTTNRLSLLTVSARQRSAVVASTAGAANSAVLYAFPVTLRSLIED